MQEKYTKLPNRIRFGAETSRTSNEHTTEEKKNEISRKKKPSTNLNVDVNEKCKH